MLAILKTPTRGSLWNISRIVNFVSEFPIDKKINNSPHTDRTSKLAFHSSVPSRGLEEFFDKEVNWGEEEIKVGRAWKKEELRIKSNEDLHKLWFVLLKERNMLLTMEEAAKREFRIFPNPERIDKVDESMENLEDVVRERNKAYYFLETGEDGERPPPEPVDLAGTVIRYQKEYSLPKHLNKEYLEDPIHQELGDKHFFRLMREKEIYNEFRRVNRMKNEVFVLFRKFPDLDIEALQEKYPEIDVKDVKLLTKSRGPHNNNMA